MIIDQKLTEHIAALSGIRLSDRELVTMTRDLASVIGYMEKLESLDIDNIEPLSHVQERVNYTREDNVMPSMPRGDVFVNAARVNDKYIITPKTFG